MSWSLNEIESLARKAAKGAGHSWGMAEEAGKSVRWLCAAGLPGAEALAGLLQRNDGRAYEDCCPDCVGPVWQAKGEELCPVITGAAICDRAGLLADGVEIQLAATSYPLLLVPYIASASDISGASISVSWLGFTMSRANRESRFDMEEAAPLSTCQEAIVIRKCDTPSGERLRRAYRGTIPLETKDILLGFAQRTYAPDTAESRLSGAGAGLTDND